MHDGRVVPMRRTREPVARHNTGGWLGLSWRYEPGVHGGSPHLIGFRPDHPGVELARLKAPVLPGYATAEDLMVAAQILSDYEDGAAALMAAAMEQEGQTDD